MKCSQQMKAIVVGLVFTALPVASQTYGPNGCVSISRSQQGTCVIATNCGETVNIDNVEFAFDCGNAAAVQKHSFGVGGFDSVEDFDTGIKCAKCTVPESHKVHEVHKENVEKAPVHMLARQTASQKDDLVDKYGPGNCVAAWKGTTGTCMLRTDCKDQDISKYNMGMLCVQNATSGENVKHVFGVNSFDPEEEFDTLIKCEKCLGLREAKGSEAIAAAGAKPEDLVKQVNSLVDEVGAMQAGLEKIKSDVKVLNEKVPKLFTVEAKKDDAKEGEAKEGEEKKAESFLGHHRSTKDSLKKHRRKQSQKHRHSSEDDDADEEDNADDEGTDDGSSSKQMSKDQDDEQDRDDGKDKDQDDTDDKQVDDKDSEEAN